MQLLVPLRIQQQLTEALGSAGTREIGGIMMGEHVGPNVFRIEEITVQSHSGTFATFVRAVFGVLMPLKRFFERTGRNYERFNYLGEWHSHPSFAPVPSPRDHQTMSSMVNSAELGAHFLALLIVKLGKSRYLESSVTVYQPGRPPSVGKVCLE